LISIPNDIIIKKIDFIKNGFYVKHHKKNTGLFHFDLPKCQLGPVFYKKPPLKVKAENQSIFLLQKKKLMTDRKDIHHYYKINTYNIFIAPFRY
jgi:hypothetical protein